MRSAIHFSCSTEKHDFLPRTAQDTSFAFILLRKVLSGIPNILALFLMCVPSEIDSRADVNFSEPQLPLVVVQVYIRIVSICLFLKNIEKTHFFTTSNNRVRLFIYFLNFLKRPSLQRREFSLLWGTNPLL